MKIAYDEMYDADGSVRESYSNYANWLKSTSDNVIARKREEALVQRKANGKGKRKRGKTDRLWITFWLPYSFVGDTGY